jgi:hypothetical protein
MRWKRTSQYIDSCNINFGLYLTSFLERSYVVYAAACILILEANEALGRSYVHSCHVGKMDEVPVDSNKQDNRIWLSYKQLDTSERNIDLSEGSMKRKFYTLSQQILRNSLSNLFSSTTLLRIFEVQIKSLSPDVLVEAFFGRWRNILIVSFAIHYQLISIIWEYDMISAADCW